MIADDVIARLREWKPAHELQQHIAMNRQEVPLLLARIDALEASAKDHVHLVHEIRVLLRHSTEDGAVGSSELGEACARTCLALNRSLISTDALEQTRATKEAKS